MAILIAGILLFLGVHCLSMFRGVRARLVERFGLKAYKSACSLATIVGFALIVWGFSRYRAEGLIVLWTPPTWGRHLALALMPFAFIALACSRPAPSKLRGLLRHPMLVAIKIWALAHLLANGDLGGLILFGSFVAYAVADRISVKRRGDAGATGTREFTRFDAASALVGIAAYALMLFLHPILIGVPVLHMG